MTENPLTSADLAQRRHGFGYADGNYFCHCLRCDKDFIGAKRSVRCALCADAAAIEWDGLSDAQKQSKKAFFGIVIEYLWRNRS